MAIVVAVLELGKTDAAKTKIIPNGLKTAIIANCMRI